MARRRLMTILATTCVAGMVTAPALATPLDLVTEPVEEVVTEVETVVETVTEPVDESVTEAESTTETVTDSVTEAESTGDVVESTTEVVTETTETVTDPVEDLIAPDDPDPSPSPSDSGTSSEGERRAEPTAPTTSDGPGGLLPGGGVVAAGGDARPAGSDGGATTSSRGTTAGGGFDLDGIGVTRFGGGTASTSRVPDPEVAPPLADDPGVVEAPSVLEPETPAVLAGGVGASAEDGGVVTALLRALAAAMVLGTGAAWTRRATEEA